MNDRCKRGKAVAGRAAAGSNLKTLGYPSDGGRATVLSFFYFFHPYSFYYHY